MKTRLLSMEEAADYLENSIIKKSHNHGFAIVHIGETLAGVEFVFVNSSGGTVLTESL